MSSFEFDDDILLCEYCGDFEVNTINSLCNLCKLHKDKCRECNTITFYTDLCSDEWCYLKWETVTVTYYDGSDKYGRIDHIYDEERRLSIKEFNDLYNIKYRKSLILERILISKKSNIFNNLPKELVKYINKYVFGFPI
jgi:hypothetical protein